MDEEQQQLVNGVFQSSSSNAISNQNHGTFSRKWLLGIFFLVCVALIWTFASVLVQYIFHDLGFDGPFFLTYVATSLFTVNLPFYYFKVRNQNKTLTRKTINDTFKISCKIAPVWFVANFAYNQSLSATTVTSSTVISSTSAIFTYIFSVLFLNEKSTMLKLLGVMLCVAGNITTVWNDNNSSSSSNQNRYWWGDVVALAGAVLYGVYTIQLRQAAPNDDAISIPLFFGLLGAINAVILFPAVIFLHVSGWESLDSLNGSIIGLLVLKGLVDNVLSDYLWARAVVLTSPTVATIGLSLTVPFAIVSDFMLHGMLPTLATCIASFLVLLGFVVINIATV